MTDLILSDTFDRQSHILLLAHGAGAPPNSDFMDAFAHGLSQHGVGVARFAFAYMSERMTGGTRRPPPRVERLVPEFEAAIETVRSAAKRDAILIIGGKSMGGRIATLVAAGNTVPELSGCVCLGYPFHPPRKPDTLRVAHLRDLATPTLIVQGTRDALGSKDDVASYDLSPSIRLHWLEDGDHDFAPRVRSGFTQAEHILSAAAETARFTQSLPA